MKLFFLFLMLLLLLQLACTLPKSASLSDDQYRFEITSNADYSFGYDIYKGNKLIIHQTCIPAVPGNLGFKAESDAKAVAKLVIDKIKREEWPPSVTVEELDSLKIKMGK